MEELDLVVESVSVKKVPAGPKSLTNEVLAFVNEAVSVSEWLVENSANNSTSGVIWYLTVVRVLMVSRSVSEAVENVSEETLVSVSWRLGMRAMAATAG